MATRKDSATLLNPLDKYNTYSYQHQLIVSDTSEAFRSLFESGGDSFARFANMSNFDAPVTLNGGTFAMIVNTMVDSSVVIDGLNYTTIYTGTEESIDIENQQIIKSDLSMTLREPSGIQFINRLIKLSDQTFKTGFTGLVFALRTIFIGHRPDGKTDTIKLAPIYLILKNMSASFDSNGGTYGLSFLGLTNGGAQAIPALYFVQRNGNYRAGDATLGSILQNFQTTLNNQLEATKNKLGKGRQVRYLFTYPERWKSFKIDSLRDNYIEKIFKIEQNKTDKQDAEKRKAEAASQDKKTEDSKTGQGAAYVSVNPKLTVDQILVEFFKRCPELYKITKGKDNKDIERVFFKITNSVTTSDKYFTVHYDMTDFFAPYLPDDKKTQDTLDKNQRKQYFVDDQATIPKHGIEFDYIFSGANSQILTFDMKINNAIVLLDAHAPTNEKATGLNNTATDTTKKDNTDSTSKPGNSKADPQLLTTTYFRDNDPAVMPDMSKDEKRGYNYLPAHAVKERQSYLSDLTNLYADSFASIKVKIRGNPVFLAQAIRPSAPDDPVLYQQYQAKKREIAYDRVKKQLFNVMIPSGMKDWLDQNIDVNSISENVDHVADHFPIFVKFNIYTPTNEPNSELYAEKFWYTGWYWVTEVAHSFADGVFEQELTCLAYNLGDIQQQNTQISGDTP